MYITDTFSTNKLLTAPRSGVKFAGKKSLNRRLQDIAKKLGRLPENQSVIEGQLKSLFESMDSKEEQEKHFLKFKNLAKLIDSTRKSNPYKEEDDMYIPVEELAKVTGIQLEHLRADMNNFQSKFQWDKTRNEHAEAYYEKDLLYLKGAFGLVFRVVSKDYRCYPL